MRETLADLPRERDDVTDTDYDVVLALYGDITDDFMEEHGDVPMILAASDPGEEHSYHAVALPWGDMGGLAHAAYELHLHTEPPVEHLLLVLPMFYAASKDPDDFANLSHGDLEAAYERGDERVTQALVVFDATLHETTMMAFQPPLNEPLISKPTADGQGHLSDMVSRLHTAINMPRLG